ncbi:hypothetical protein WAE56_01315 [Iodobacter sp. LRB]|uniref:hypothetical protein n=1 Tax=unclassified Iodobacter TaxID=235634 RepID=UPI000C0E6A67|nr:hypothetical protein [Iodobacter sp. BJB302]PHV00811.1 hypothetical protein CSQ88_15390 [Iodobacter sp. BJB302]
MKRQQTLMVCGLFLYNFGIGISVKAATTRIDLDESLFANFECNNSFDMKNHVVLPSLWQQKRLFLALERRIKIIILA